MFLSIRSDLCRRPGAVSEHAAAADWNPAALWALAGCSVLLPSEVRQRCWAWKHNPQLPRRDKNTCDQGCIAQAQSTDQSGESILTPKIKVYTTIWALKLQNKSFSSKVMKLQVTIKLPQNIFPLCYFNALWFKLIELLKAADLGAHQSLFPSRLVNFLNDLQLL